ncbi:MAG TPA: GNAT family N-acetyltransferase [Alphaproteobacteria bacterium]|nr:GNAT family N-acetyltransferase [Alphaproteobacteria bacterium]HAJ48368.1 GNAT family N-acetyltransferase [Alphaproteobacteria bacterium]
MSILVTPAHAHLSAYKDALDRGWSPDNENPQRTAQDHLRKISEDADAFLASLDDPNALAGPIRLPDGQEVPRLPGHVRWIWSQGFAGAIGFRWQPGTAVLPPYTHGHIGYSVVPWARNQGLAKRALHEMLDLARSKSLPHVEVTCYPDNIASQRVILACGGTLTERFTTLPAYGSREALRFRIAL